MVTNTGAWVQHYGSKAPLLVVSMALLPADNKGQFAQCAAGAFDGYFRQVGANLQASPAPRASSCGWAGRRTSAPGSTPGEWTAPTRSPAYVQCWRHAALALKAGGPRLQLEWTNAKKTQNALASCTGRADMYPGDDVVDLVGRAPLRHRPAKNTQAVWDQYYTAT